MPNKKINELSVRTPSLNDLMIVGDPSTGYSYKATINALTAFVGGNIQFSTLGGISLTNPSNGQVLQFNGTNWVNATISVPVTSVFGRTGNVVATEGDYSLTQLGDVTLSTPSTNQVLQYNGTAWVNATLTDNGITSLNGLTAVSQTFATGTSGTDFAISSTTSTHTFNLPTASATNRGALSSADWSTFNAKQDAITLTTTGSSGSATLVGATLNIPTYTLAGLGGVSGSGTTNYVSKWTSSSALGNSLVFDNGTNVGIGTTSPSQKLEVNGGMRLYTTGAFSVFAIGATNVGGDVLELSGDTRGSIVNSKNNYNLRFQTNGTDRATFFNSTGNLLLQSGGSHVDNGYRLDVNGTARVQGTAVFQTANNTSSIQDLVSATTYAALYLDQGTPSLSNYTLASNGSQTLLNAGSTSVYIRVNNTDRLEIDANGVGKFSHTGGPITFIQAYPSSSTFAALYQGKVSASTGNYSLASDATQTYLNAPTSGNIDFRINNSTISRFTSAGRLLIGTTTESTYLLDVNGTARVVNDAYFATSSGNVGIGTTSPGNKLQVVTGNVDGIRVQSSGSGYLETGKTGGARYRWANDFNVGDALELQYGASGATPTTTRMTIFSNGNIQIGSNVDQGYRFFVNGTLSNNGGAAFATTSGNVGIGTTSITSATNQRVVEVLAQEYPTLRLKTVAGSVNAEITANGGNGTFSIATTTTHPMLFWTNNAERMRIFASTGNVAIGTTTDAGYRLDVNGTARVQNNSGLSLFIGSITSVGSTTPAILSLGGSYGTNTAGNVGNIKLKIYEDANAINTNGIGISSQLLEIHGDVNIGFFTGNSTARTERVRITQSGTLAVGTSSPNASALLDVSSTTKGFLPPRMTGAQAEAIATPAAGLMIYANNGNGTTITSTGWWGYDGTTWVKLN